MQTPNNEPLKIPIQPLLSEQVLQLEEAHEVLGRLLGVAGLLLGQKAFHIQDPVEAKEKGLDEIFKSFQTPQSK